MSHQAIGVLIPEAMYTRQALGRLGIGRMLLYSARQEGVSPYVVGNTFWYCGSDLIEWMKRHPQAEQKRVAG
jgi:hypothetical protein